MTRLNLFILIILLISGMVVAAFGQKTTSGTGVTNEKPSEPSIATTSGEDVFKANCGRCHAPPTGMPQRITGTVIMHMRVRARLSRQDELLLIRYLAP
jgi:hypothetical protein